MRNRDVDHPFLRPLWRRAVLVAFCAAWAVFEFASGSPGWGMMFGFMAAYGAWTYLVTYAPSVTVEDQDQGKE